MIHRTVVVVLLVLAGLSLTEKATLAADLRLALLPIPDVLPVYVAMDKGYFKEQSIEVEPLTVGSAVERDQLMQAGSVDGMVTDLSGTAAFNRDTTRVKVISLARQPYPDAPLFRVVAAPGSTVKAPGELAGVAVGISKNTVIEYITTRLLRHGGVATDQLVYSSIPVLPERMQLLLSGQVPAATLPEPLASSALAAGAVEVMNDTALPEASVSVLTFSNESLAAKADAVRGFMLAWEKAVADLNSDPQGHRELMLKYIRVPKNVQASFQLPPFPQKSLPTRVQWEDVVSWMQERQLLTTPVTYESSVTDQFLP